jgi:hypothetical protein
MALSGIDTGEYGAKAIDRLLAVIEALGGCQVTLCRRGTHDANPR